MIRKILTSSLITLVAVGGFFVNVEQQENQITQTVSYELSSVTQVHAAEAAKTTEGDTKTKEMLNNVVAALNIILGVITIIVSPAVMLAGWLMSPDWTSGDLFNLRGVMHSLWVTVSNILYFVYAVLLIVIALATMFNQEKFGYRVMLPKLALGIILVPFTWWFVQWTISLASVVTASVISIPHDTINKVQGTNSKGWWNTENIPKNIIVSGSDNTIFSENKPNPCPGDCLKPSEFLQKSSGMYGYMIVYAYSIFKLNDVKKLDTVTDVAKTILKLIEDGIVSTIMFAVFGILVIALIFMLMMRAIKLWFYAIFSPLFTLHFVVGKDLLGEKLDDFSLKEFIGLAFVPAVVGLTLSFGLVIVSALQSSNTGTSNNLSSNQCTSDIIQSSGCEIMGIMGNPENKITRKIGDVSDGSGELYKATITTVQFGGITFTFYGKLTGTPEAAAASAADTSSVISSVGGIFGTIIVDLIALIFIWASFMAAKNVSKAVKAAIDPFEQMGKKIGQLGMSLPKYAPILPPSMGGSVAGANRAVDIASHLPEKAAEERLKNSDLGKRLGLGDQASTVELRRAVDIMKNAGDKAFDKTSQEYRDIGKTYVSQAGKYDPSDNFKEIGEGLKKLESSYKRTEVLKGWGIDENLAKKISDAYQTGSADPKSNTALQNALKELGNKGVNPATTSGNNMFNLKTVIDAKANKTQYELEAPGLNIKAESKDELIKTIENNIAKLASVDDESIKTALGKENIDSKKIDEIIEKLKKEREKNK